MSTYTPIASQTLTATTSSITFSSIPQGYTDLILVVDNLKHSYPGSTVVRDDFIQFNGDTGANYSMTMLYGDGSGAYSIRGTGQSAIVSDYAMASGAVGENTIININNYSNSTTYKTVLQRCNNTIDRTTAFVNLWRNTAAITSIKIGPSGSYTMAAGATFSIYGIAAGATGAKAAGGIVTSDNSYVYHTFLNSGIFMPYQNLTCDYLVVAGGGGGANNVASGGGAGGLRSTVTATGGGGSLETALSLTAQAYAVTVGAGGNGGASTNAYGTAGSDSIFSTITSTGGGRGAAFANTGGNGGSGGGGGGSGGTAGTGTTNQGFAGGTGGSNGAGGGGGAGSVGAIGTANGGNGGGGVTTSITGSSVTYAGGGGGGGFNTTGGTATGGGGNGGSNGGSGSAATANTGGGGGGGDWVNNGPGNGGNGGSGIVIVRYAI